MKNKLFNNLKTWSLSQKYTVAALAWMLIILSLCATPGNQLPSIWTIPHLDKIAHFGLYLILSFLWMGAFISKQSDFSFQKAIGYTFLLGASYGILIEMMQEHFFLNRNFEIPDIIANIIGNLVGIVAYWYYYQLNNSQ